jgi:chromosome segregation ATPase
MRYSACLFVMAFPLGLFAQTAETDQPVLQKLLVEVQQLRAAIERSTLLGTRTQLAISQLQLQENKVTTLSRQLNDVRDTVAQVSSEKAKLAQRIKSLEETPPASPDQRRDLEAGLKQLKLELEQFAAAEQRNSGREGDLTSQLQAAQRDVQDSRARITEMERLLDAAIQQMLKVK